ncbi:uncharacterized protein [Miscanthus floridulus]|uniref:uncharacterized protein n=1 Tax=Miscanthus floridulus TaxID=154761 RepID=UPI0034581818
MAPPQLPPEIVEDILLRFPPDHPAHLVRAALVCKHWSRLIAGADFRRRYRQRHREAPVLGLVANLADTGGAARFVPTRCAFRPARTERPGYRAHDARHGRVLLNRMRAPPGQEAAEDSALAVWDPIADEQRRLPLLPRPRYVRTWNAAVLCAAAAACDHLDCHREPFRVVFVGIDAKEMFAHVYSSESAAWSEATTADLPGDDQLDVALPGVLARDALYFLLHGREIWILKCDPATLEMSVVRLPRIHSYAPPPPRIVLMTMEDGGLGFAQVDLNCTLRLWSMKIRPDGGLGADGDTRVWVISRAIDLKAQLFTPRQLPPHALGFDASPLCVVVAFGDGAGVIFLKTNDGLYSFDLKSDQAVKVDMSSGFYDIIPFMSIYTPVLRVASTDEGPCA